MNWKHCKSVHIYVQNKHTCTIMHTQKKKKNKVNNKACKEESQTVRNVLCNITTNHNKYKKKRKKEGVPHRGELFLYIFNLLRFKIVAMTNQTHKEKKNSANFFFFLLCRLLLDCMFI